MKNDPFSFDAFQEYLYKDGLVAITHLVVEMMEILICNTIYMVSSQHIKSIGRQIALRGRCVALVLHKKKVESVKPYAHQAHARFI